MAKQVRDVPKLLQEVFEKALMLPADMQLVEGVHLGRPTQVMQIARDVHNSCKSRYI